MPLVLVSYNLFFDAIFILARSTYVLMSIRHSIEITTPGRCSVPKVDFWRTSYSFCLVVWAKSKTNHELQQDRKCRFILQIISKPKTTYNIDSNSEQFQSTYFSIICTYRFIPYYFQRLNYAQRFILFEIFSQEIQENSKEKGLFWRIMKSLGINKSLVQVWYIYIYWKYQLNVISFEW